MPCLCISLWRISVKVYGVHSYVSTFMVFSTTHQKKGREERKLDTQFHKTNPVQSGMGQFCVQTLQALCFGVRVILGLSVGGTEFRRRLEGWLGEWPQTQLSLWNSTVNRGFFQARCTTTLWRPCVDRICRDCEWDRDLVLEKFPLHVLRRCQLLQNMQHDRNNEQYFQGNASTCYLLWQNTD